MTRAKADRARELPQWDTTDGHVASAAGGGTVVRFGRGVWGLRPSFTSSTHPREERRMGHTSSEAAVETGKTLLSLRGGPAAPGYHPTMVKVGGSLAKMRESNENMGHTIVCLVRECVFLYPR